MRLELRIVIVITLSFSFINVLKAQNCEQGFIKDVLRVSQVKNEKFHKKSHTILKSYSNADYHRLENAKVLNIPVVFSTKEGAKISGAGNLIKKKLLCYIDGKSMIFDEAIVVQDSAVLGAIIQNPNPATPFEFVRDVDSYRAQLAKTIIQINPEIIFSIYNIPRCYWYIKDNQLYVLSFEHETSETVKFKIYEGASYINDYLNEKELCFLSHKRVVVISGR
jgi:hypothetical protein